MKLLKRIGTFIAPLKAIITGKDKKRESGTEQNHKDLQDYFVALQKKRSGDTLIALSLTVGWFSLYSLFCPALEASRWTLETSSALYCYIVLYCVV